MSISTEIDNGGKRFIDGAIKKIPGWIQFAVGEDAIKFKDFAKDWVYGLSAYQERTGALKKSLYANLIKKKGGGGFTTDWIVGPNPTSYNWTGRWIPSSPNYNGTDRDFIHKAWTAYNATNNIKENVGRIIKEKLDGFEQ